MAAHDAVRPTPPPRGPALVRSTVGVLLLALGGAADVGCVKKHGPPPMPPPPMPDPTYGNDEGPMPAPDPPMPATTGPIDLEEAPMVAPMPDPG